jgi:hypothetical protein
MMYNMELGEAHTSEFKGPSHPGSSTRSFPDESCFLMVFFFPTSSSEAMMIAVATTLRRSYARHECTTHAVFLQIDPFALNKRSRERVYPVCSRAGKAGRDAR